MKCRSRSVQESAICGGLDSARVFDHHAEGPERSGPIRFEGWGVVGPVVIPAVAPVVAKKRSRRERRALPAELSWSHRAVWIGRDGTRRTSGPRAAPDVLQEAGARRGHRDACGLPAEY